MVRVTRGRRVGVLLVAALLLTLLSTGIWAQAPIRVVVNGREVASDVPPFIQGGRIFVTLRFVAQALGATVDWNDATRTVTVTAGPAQPGAGRVTILGADPGAAYRTPVGMTRNGVTLIVEQVTRTAGGSVVTLTIENASASYISYNTDARLWVGNTYYQATSADPDLIGNLLPGRSATGTITFTAIPVQATAVRLTASFAVPGQTALQFELGVKLE